MLRSIVRPAVSTVLSTRIASVSGVTVAPIISPIFSLSVRSIVIDRATKTVSLKRRMRRAVLRKMGRKDNPHIQAGLRVTSAPPPLASMENAAANLHQFVAFLVRQSNQREQNTPAVAKSTQIVRDAAKPGWELTFAELQKLMRLPENQHFRACEELLGAVSDPTTDLGQNGLLPEDLAFTLKYVNDTMTKVLTLMQSKNGPLEKAGGIFQQLEAEEQYEYAGAIAVQYLVAKLCNNTSEENAVLLRARAQQVLPPPRTMLADAMRYDVYPPHTPEALLASVKPKPAVIGAKST